jgi:hypothetical protein
MVFVFSARPQVVSASRFTLHSASLPRPQYPVPVSVSSIPAPPVYKRSTTFTSFSSSSSGSENKSSLMSGSGADGYRGGIQSKLMDTKGAKHAANLYKRGGMGR